MAGELPALMPISPEDKGPGVVVIGYASVVTSIILTGIRIATSILLKRGFSWDDGTIVASTVSLAGVLSGPGVSSGAY
jgi:hypothetical protein